MHRIISTEPYDKNMMHRLRHIEQDLLSTLHWLQCTEYNDLDPMHGKLCIN